MKRSILTTFIIVSLLTVSACNSTSKNENNNSKPTQQEKPTETKPNDENSSEEPKNENPTSYSFEVKEKKDFEPTFHSEWNASPDNSLKATLEGKGEGSEEGEAVLVLNDSKTNISKLYKLKDNPNSQFTPKYIEWIDNKRIFVIIGMSYGMVTTGGDLYELNLETNTLQLTMNLDDPKEEMMSITNNKNGTFTYKKHIYTDDNFNEGYEEEKTVTEKELVKSN